jgi:hypothetical protein
MSGEVRFGEMPHFIRRRAAFPIRRSIAARCGSRKTLIPQIARTGAPERNPDAAGGWKAACRFCSLRIWEKKTQEPL